VIDAMDDSRPLPSNGAAVGVSHVATDDEPAIGVSRVTADSEPAVGVSRLVENDQPAVGVAAWAEVEAPAQQAMRGIAPDGIADQPGVRPAVVRTIAANCSRAHAYATFTARIGEWWPAAFSASGVDLADVVIEPHVGGRVYEISKNGDEFTWGSVKAIQDGTAITMLWTLGVGAPNPTELDVRFAGDITGDLADGDLVADVTLRHSGFVSDDDHGRFESEGGWTDVLAAYKACAEA
jgi:uncharacterized protein YndB with AHSA1/START domain